MVGIKNVFSEREIKGQNILEQALTSHDVDLRTRAEKLRRFSKSITILSKLDSSKVKAFELQRARFLSFWKDVLRIIGTEGRLPKRGEIVAKKASFPTAGSVFFWRRFSGMQQSCNLRIAKLQKAKRPPKRKFTRRRK